MPSDTFGEVVKDLRAWAFAASKPDGSPTPDSEFLEHAARLLEAAGRECRAGRKRMDRDGKVVNSTMQARSLYAQARLALDALAPEMKEVGR